MVACSLPLAEEGSLNADGHAAAHALDSSSSQQSDDEAMAVLAEQKSTSKIELRQGDPSEVVASAMLLFQDVLEAEMAAYSAYW